MQSSAEPMPNKGHEVFGVVVLPGSPSHASCLTPSPSSGPITPITRHEHVAHSHRTNSQAANIQHRRLQHFNTIAD